MGCRGLFHRLFYRGSDIYMDMMNEDNLTATLARKISMGELKRLSVNENKENLGNYLNSILPKPHYWDKLKNHLIESAKAGKTKFTLNTEEHPTIVADISLNYDLYKKFFDDNDLTIRVLGYTPNPTGMMYTKKISSVIIKW